MIPVDQAITIPKKHWKKLKIDTCLLHDIAAEGTPCQVENWQTKQPLPAQVLNVDDKEKKIQDRDQPCSAPSEHQIVNNNTGGHVSLAGKQIIRQDQNQNFIEVPTKRTLENGRHVEVITCFPNVTVKELLQYRKPKTPRISKEKNGSYEKFVIHDTGEDTSMETDSWISQFNRNVSPLDSSSAPAGTSERLESNNNASNSMSLKPATITSSQAANLDNVFKLPKAPLRPAAMNTLPAGNFDSAFKIPKVPKKPAAMTRNQAGNVDSAFKISEVPMKPATITTAQASNLDKAFNFPHVSRSNHVANTEEGEKSEGQANSGAVAPAAACPFTATNPFYPFGFGDRCSEDCPRCEARLNGPKLELHPAEKAKLRRDHGKSLRAKFNEKVKALYERQWFHRQNRNIAMLSTYNEQTTNHFTFLQLSPLLISRTNTVPRSWLPTNGV